MTQTQPKFNVSFKELAVLAIQRQERGEVIMILNDSTQATITKKTYMTLGDVDKSDWTSANYDRIAIAFLGNPSKVTVIKELTDSGKTFADTLALLDTYENYVLCMPEAEATEQSSIITYIGKCREKNNYAVAVLANATSPDEDYIINFTTAGIKANVTGTETAYTTGDYTARVAGALSGLASTRSLTYYELAEITECTLSTDADADAGAGKLIVLYQDGSYKFGRAVNSLVTLTDGITEAFQKIRIINTLDTIANDIVYTFRTGYVGKYVNNYSNKLRFISAINSYLLTLVDEGLLEGANQNEVELSYTKIKAYLEAKGVETEGMTYKQIIESNTGSKVLLDGVCSPTDAMEDLDLGMYLFQELETAEA